jgi:hypothetical protein
VQRLSLKWPQHRSAQGDARRTTSVIGTASKIRRTTKFSGTGRGNMATCVLPSSLPITPMTTLPGWFGWELGQLRKSGIVLPRFRFSKKTYALHSNTHSFRTTNFNRTI